MPTEGALPTPRVLFQPPPCSTHKAAQDVALRLGLHVQMPPTEHPESPDAVACTSMEPPSAHAAPAAAAMAAVVDAHSFASSDAAATASTMDATDDCADDDNDESEVVVLLATATFADAASSSPALPTRPPAPTAGFLLAADDTLDAHAPSALSPLIFAAGPRPTCPACPAATARAAYIGASSTSVLASGMEVVMAAPSAVATRAHEPRHAGQFAFSPPCIRGSASPSRSPTAANSGHGEDDARGGMEEEARGGMEEDAPAVSVTAFDEGQRLASPTSAFAAADDEDLSPTFYRRRPALPSIIDSPLLGACAHASSSTPTVTPPPQTAPSQGPGCPVAPLMPLPPLPPLAPLPPPIFGVAAHRKPALSIQLPPSREQTCAGLSPGLASPGSCGPRGGPRSAHLGPLSSGSSESGALAHAARKRKRKPHLSVHWASEEDLTTIWTYEPLSPEGGASPHRNRRRHRTATSVFSDDAEGDGGDGEADGDDHHAEGGGSAGGVDMNPLSRRHGMRHGMLIGADAVSAHCRAEVNQLCRKRRKGSFARPRLGGPPNPIAAATPRPMPSSRGARAAAAAVAASSNVALASVHGGAAPSPTSARMPSTRAAAQPGAPAFSAAPMAVDTPASSCPPSTTATDAAMTDAANIIGSCDADEASAPAAVAIGAVMKLESAHTSAMAISPEHHPSSQLPPAPPPLSLADASTSSVADCAIGTSTLVPPIPALARQPLLATLSNGYGTNVGGGGQCVQARESPSGRSRNSPSASPTASGDVGANCSPRAKSPTRGQMIAKRASAAAIEAAASEAAASEAASEGANSEATAEPSDAVSSW